MLGPGSEERGVQKTLTEAEKLELIKSKFVTRMCLYGNKGGFIGEATRREDGDFVFEATVEDKVYFWSLGSVGAIAPVRPFKYPVYIRAGETFTIKIDSENK